MYIFQHWKTPVNNQIRFLEALDGFVKFPILQESRVFAPPIVFARYWPKN